MPPRLTGGHVTKLFEAHDRYLVRVSINGKPAKLIVDTAATITALTPEAARQRGLIAGAAVEVNDGVGHQTTLDLEIAGLAHRDLRAVIVDLPEGRRAGRNDGVLGLDVLGRYDFVVDYAHNEVALYPPGTLATLPITRTMGRFQFVRAVRGLIIAHAHTAETTYPAIIDLGSPYSAMSPHAGFTLDVRIGSGELHLGHVFPLGFQTVRRLGFTNHNALLVGSDAFAKRVVAFAYQSGVGYVSDRPSMWW